jgi:hypothetical protein
MRVKYRIALAILGAVLGCAVLGVVLYRLRAPLLLVLDEEFIVLYGDRRSAAKRTELSLRLFRRVAVAHIAEGASPDVVAFAAAAAAARPYAALFPARYRQGALRYAEQAPETPTGILGGGALFREADNRGLRFIETDKTADLYLAGRCAALFARQRSGRILFFAGDLIDWDDREAFSRGLRDQGFVEEALFVDRGTEYVLPDRLSCVVMTSPADNFPENNGDLPIILFSWIDPGLTARSVKLIFDDSPWALALEAARALRRGEELSRAASEVLPLWDRIGDAALRRDLKELLKNNAPPG